MNYDKNVKNSKKPVLMMLFIGRVFSFKEGTLMILSTPVSYFLTKMINNLFENVPLKMFHVPIFSSSVIFFVFFLFYIMDFFTGISASKKIEKDKFKISSDKLWRSFWKLYGYITLLTLLNVFCITFAVIGNTFLYTLFLYLIIFIGFMFSMYEFHSIGENWEILYGKKHRIFNFFEKLTAIVEEGVINKIKKL